jgi:RNA polymerase sigma factor (sigma-70 family)
MRANSDELLPTRASLLVRLKDWRDQASWQRFFDTYWTLIYHVARRAGLTDFEAQEVVQQTFIEVAKKMPGFHYDPAQGQFKGWLLKITRWRILDQFRSRRFVSVPEPEADTDEQSDVFTPDQIIDPSSNALDALWEAEWQETILNAALANVKRRIEPQRYQIFDFYVNRQWPAAKVASTFNVSVDEVYMSKHRCTEMLKREVARIEQEGA